MATTTKANAFDVLSERGLFAQTTDEDIRKRFERPVTVYIGADATASSLHLGSMLPLLVLAHLQRCGHKPVLLLGGATTLVGDPTGRIESRKMLSRDEIARNVESIRRQAERFITIDDSPTGGVVVNNIDWLGDLNWIEVLRDIGPHFSINRMLAMDSVKSRLEAGGLTFLEFNYMILQGYDFVHLHRELGCTVQMGGQDQWGNIVAGVELGRRMAGVSLAGMTFPLLLKADGTKFGKSESGNVWLDAELTPPYEMYQYLRNIPDADVGKCLGYLTFVPMDEVNKLCAGEGAELNTAKETLAYEVTKIVHGEDAATRARDDSRKAFSVDKDVTGQSIPSETVAISEIDGQALPALLVRAGLANSGGEAKRLIKNGGVKLGDDPVGDITRTVSSADVTDGYILLRVGKKKLFRFDIF